MCVIFVNTFKINAFNQYLENSIDRHLSLGFLGHDYWGIYNPL